MPVAHLRSNYAGKVESAPSDVPALPGAVDRWAARALAELAAVPGVRRVGMALLEGGGRRLLFTASDRIRGADLGWCYVDAYADVPLNDAIRTGAAVVGALDELDPRYAPFVAAQQGTGYRAIAAVPLVADRVLGGFVLFHAEAQDDDLTYQDDLRAVAGRLADLLRDAQQVAAPSLPPGAAVPSGTRVAVHEVPADPAAVAGARRFLRSTLASWDVGTEVADDAALCLSELVTNALVHTYGAALVEVELYAGVLTTRVHDAGAGAAAREPLRGSGDPFDVHGHGLQVVEALASSWGRERGTGHAAVWFTFDLR
ncbi:MAG: ATP-binding region ATPase domain protein [Marmoricola sp.]|nr:ATP-binding region ATPase domain protein [Marmoricola sp.]